MGWKKFLYLICTMVLANFTIGQNLIVNPGAEMPLSVGWNIISGNWQQGSVAVNNISVPYDGNYLFFAGQESDAELYQDVDVRNCSTKIDAGLANFTYTGHMRSYEQGTNDQARETVEYRDSLGLVLDSFQTTYSDTSSKWITATDTRTAKKGTRTIRIRLLSHRRTGADNDGYHDGLSLTLSIIDPCIQNYTWTTWSNFIGVSATGTINLNGQPVKVTMSSNFSFTSTPNIFGYGTFSGFSSTIPNTIVPATTWSLGSGGTTTMRFSQKVNNPILLFASLGSPNIKVTLRLSKSYTTIYDGGGMKYPNDTTIVGQEGYAILLFPGSFDSITIYSTTPENYTNITWGLNPPLFPVNIAGSLTGCNSVTLNATGGKSYVWNGGRYPNNAINTFDSSGTYFLTVKDTNGCSVTTSATIFIKPKSFSSIKQTICQGQTFLGRNSAGIYVDTLLAANGCDSLRTLILTVKPSSSSTISQSICQGQSIWGHSASGVYVDTLLAANGCDSIRTLILTVNPSSSSTINQSICRGQTYLGYGTSGVYIDTLRTARGCDSIRTLYLTVKPSPSSTINQTICQGQSFLGRSKSGIYVDTLLAANGCDSVRALYLTVKPNSYFTINQRICQGQSFLGYNASGVYVDTLLAVNGCDSIRTLKLTVNPGSSSTTKQTICQGQSFWGYSIDGVYIDTLLAANGCDSIRTLILTILKTPQPNLGSNVVICKGDSLVLDPGTFSTYLWQDSSTAKTFIVKQAGVYAVTVTNFCGLKADTVSITENVCNVYFPSAFTPNDDGKNDIFKILNPNSIFNYHLSVYNRYGNLIFQTSNPLMGWDGNINGQKAQTDTFIWACQFNKQGYDGILKMSGTVILIR